MSWHNAGVHNADKRIANSAKVHLMLLKDAVIIRNETKENQRVYSTIVRNGNHSKEAARS